MLYVKIVVKVVNNLWCIKNCGKSCILYIKIMVKVVNNLCYI